jgi:hypothetical protein
MNQLLKQHVKRHVYKLLGASSVEERRALKRSAPQVTLDEIHTRNCRVVPTRELMLERLPRGGVVAEVGVALGDFTREIMARSAPKKLHLIDLWSSERYRAGLAKIKADFAAQISDGTVEINQGLSTDRLEQFADGYFDWLYIDTDHSYATTRQELDLAARKVAPGRGRIAGHDFTCGNPVTPVPYGVIEACNEFCVRRGWEYEYLTLESNGYFSFTLKKL